MGCKFLNSRLPLEFDLQNGEQSSIFLPSIGVWPSLGHENSEVWIRGKNKVGAVI